ncbi:MAG: hypothetical protein RL217_1802 [Pseudomonadota bacterium]|jgi:hypothetical protein
MPKAQALTVLFIAALWAALVVPAWADAKVELAGGLEYDSNVAPDTLEANVNQGDYATWLKLGLGYRQNLGAFSGQMDYQLQDSRWLHNPSFNSQMHLGLGRLGYQQHGHSAELALVQAYGLVDGQDFLRLTRLSPAYGRLLNARWFMRLQGDLSEKTFADFAERNSQTQAGSLYLYRFFDRTRFYLSAQLQLKDEQAQAAVYSYQAWLVQLQLKRSWQVAGRELSVRAKGRMEERQYQGWRSDIQSRRHDWRLRAALEADFKLGAGWALHASWQQERFNSNLALADYDQYRSQIGLSFEF